MISERSFLTNANTFCFQNNGAYKLISYLTFLKSPTKKKGVKKWEIAGIELSPFGSEGYALLHV